MAVTNGPNLGLAVNGAQGDLHFTQLMAQWRGLDALVQAHVKSATTTAQPGSPADGDCYIIPSGATGAAWSGKTNQIGRYSSVAAGWEFYVPKKGWRVYVEDVPGDYQYSGTAWAAAGSGGGGSVAWGGITGTLSSQTDLQAALDGKASTASLATVATTGAYSDLTGLPTLGTAAAAATTDFATAAQGATADAALQSVVAGTNVTIDVTDPQNPVINVSSGTASVAWGGITGTLSDQTDLQAALNDKVSTSLVGAASGVAPLDSGSKVPAAYLPSYVDDVLEYANLAAFPATGSTGTIYVADDTGKIYRWSGSAYVEISPSPGSTDAVSEGTTNLYFTAARAKSAAVANSITAGVTDVAPSQDAVVTALSGKLSSVVAGTNITIDNTDPQNPILNVSSSTSTVNWGSIGGTLSSQTDLQAALDAKANTSSLATVATTGAYSDLSGTPTLGTAAAADTTDFATAAQGATADAALPATGGTMTGIFQGVGTRGTVTSPAAVSGTITLDLSAGDWFGATISAAATFALSNVAGTGLTSSFILDLTNGGAFTVTWFAGVKWAGGTAPTLTASGRDVLGFFTDDGGTTWAGFVLGKALA